MKHKNLSLYEQPLEESWHSFAMQQQQETVEPPEKTDSSENKNNVQDVDDPFKDIPLDNVDDTVKAAIEKARITTANLAKEKREASEKVDKLSKVAGAYQGRADKAEALLKRHNLSGEDSTVNKVVNPQDAIAIQLEQEYTKLGLPAEQAKNLAKINAVTVNLTRASTLQEVGSAFGPLLGKVQSINADRFLDSYTTDPESKVALQVPGVREDAQAIVNEMIKANMDVSQDAVLSAIETSLGRALMKVGGDITKLKASVTNPSPPQNQPSLLQTLFGGGGNGNGAHVHSSGTGNGLKHQTNEHTLSAGATIASMMDRHIGKTNK